MKFDRHIPTHCEHTPTLSSGKLVGTITHRAGQLSQTTMEFIVRLRDTLWRDTTASATNE